jgi:aminopeptidase N
MCLRVLLGAALFSISLATAYSQQRGFDLDHAPGKLSRHVLPHAYEIELVPDLAQLSIATGRERVGFNGTVQIDIEVRQPVRAIVLNATDISFARAIIDGVEAKFEVDSRNQTVAIAPPQMLSVGRHTLTIEYSGTILTHQEGIFYSTYDTPNGPRWVLATDLEPSGARRIFPGFDEPAFKATFRLSLAVPSTFRALSNMPIVREQENGATRKIVTFAPTPRMSSYLVVLVAGEYDRIATTVEGVDIGVVVPGHQVDQGRYALGVAARALTYFNNYFGIKYPLPKLDHVLVPRNFEGAMENWGGVTYSERALLFDETIGSEDDRKVVHEYVVHETAHQWFGNLVTMAWWDELWLNEGFASWMEKKLTDEFNPSMRIWVRTRADKEKAMAKDALRTAHPVQQPIEDESEALAAFDDITYLKGLSLVRMLEAYIGEVPFREGLRRYIAKHAYSNATGADLWAALEAASNKPIAAVALGFSRQPGIPLIQVSTTCASEKLTVTLKQDRYALNDPYASRQLWQVPVAIGRPGDDRASHIELVSDVPRTLTIDGCDRPIKANYGDSGYYRVHYANDDLKALGAAFHRLGVADRVSLMADAWAMVLAGLNPPADYLDLTKKLSDETELAVWDRVIESLRFIDDQFTDTAARETFREYARGMMKNAFNRLGWQSRPDEQAGVALLRNRLITELGAFGDSEVTAEARRRFALFMRDRAAIPATLREPIAKVVAYSADQKAYEHLVRLAHEQESEQGRMIYFLALAGARNPQLIEQTVQIARIDAKLPPAQTLPFLEQAAKESGDPDRVWRLVFANRTEILSRLSGRQRQQALARVARASSNPAVAFELKWADATRSNRGMRRLADETAEEIELKADLKPTLVPAVQQWVVARDGR